jgi:hypothetical protein
VDRSYGIVGWKVQGYSGYAVRPRLIALTAKEFEYTSFKVL